MARSLGFTAYRALSHRGAAPEIPDWPERPNGELVWLHAAETGSFARVYDLAMRLLAVRFGLHVLITTADDTQPLETPAPRLTILQRPPEHPLAVDAFLSHWHPDTLVWFWGDLYPNLITSTAKSGAVTILADAGQHGFENRRDRWLPEVSKRVLACFKHISARSPEAQARLKKLGCPADKLEASDPLVTSGHTLPAAQSDVDDLQELLSGRPVWFAANICESEISAVLTAHRRALRMSHRLLLVIEPRDADTAEAISKACQFEQLRTARWSDGAYPDDNTAVLLADLPDETGLWLRIAPVTFLGGSLTSEHPSANPFAAASLGSAVLYGPSIGNNLDAYTRLANAGAARIVNDADTLGAAVTRLIAPDHAAKMAMAGWEVVTQGAATSDRIIDLVQNSLDAIQDAV